MNKLILQLISPIKHARYMLSQEGRKLDLQAHLRYKRHLILFSILATISFLPAIIFFPSSPLAAATTFGQIITTSLFVLYANYVSFCLNWIGLDLDGDYFNNPEQLIASSQKRRFEEILDKEAIEPPDPLCCPITQTLMDFPVKGRDGHFYDFEALRKWRASRPYARYPMNPGIEIGNYLSIASIDKDKYLEIQHYKRCLIHRDNQKSTFKSLKALGQYGMVGAGLLFLITCQYGLGVAALSSGLGFLAATGLYYRDRYADLALEKKRQQVQIRKESSAPRQYSAAYTAGLAASMGYTPYIKSFLPLFEEGCLARKNPSEWYAGMQQGIEETTAKRCLTTPG